MGVDYTTKLVFGWEVNFEKVIKYLIDNKVGSCSSENPVEQNEQCMCGTDYCWDKTKFPDNVYIIAANPSFDCSHENKRYFLSLSSEKNLLNYSFIKNMDISIIEKAKEFAIMLGAEDKEPEIISVIHIW